MDLVVDANIIFAALIKNSFSYHLLFSDKFHLHTSEYIFVEIEKHKEELLQKSERMPNEFFELIEIFKRRIIIIPIEEIIPYVAEAEKITPDPDDMVYFALALRLNCAIWSNDKALKEKQSSVKVYHTHDLIKL